MNLDSSSTLDVDDCSIDELVELSRTYGVLPQDLDGETPLRDLVPAQNPSESVKSGVHWLLSDDSGGDGAYMAANGVLAPESTSETDLPPSDHDSIRTLDMEALSETQLSGKWNYFCSPAQVDAVWHCVQALVGQRVLASAKVSTKWGREFKGHSNHVVVVYTPNYFDTEDVFRVRDVLRSHCGIDETLYYKPDLWTVKGIYSSTADAFGLPRASRYSG